MKRSLIALFGGLIASGLIGAQFGTHVYSFWKEGGWQGLDRLGCAAIPLVASGETAFIPVEDWPEETPLTKEMVVILHGNTTDKNFGAITVESDEMLFNRLGKQTPDSELDPWEDGLNPVGTERTYYDSVESTEGWYASWPTEVWPGCTNYSDGRDHKPVANRWWIEIPIKADVDGRKLFFSVGITGQELTSNAIYLVSDSKELLEAGNFVREFGSNAKFAIKNRGNTSFRAADYVPLRPSDYTRDWWWGGPKYQYNNSRSYIGRVIDANYQANLNAGDNRKGVPYAAFEMSIRSDYNKQIVGSKTAFVAPEAGRLVLALCDDDQFFELQNATLQSFASTTVAKASTSDQRRFWFYNAINEGKLYEVDLKAGETAVFSYPYEKEYDENNASLYIGRLAFFPEAVRSISVTGSWSTLRYQNGQPFPYSPGVVFGGGVYREGEPITLTAISYPGHEFDRWEVVYLGRNSGPMSIPEAITNAINTANESHTPTLTLPEVESIYGSASDEAAIVVRAHWKDVQIAQVRTDPLDVAKYKGGRPTGNGLVIDGHEQTFSAPESVATGSKDGKVYAFTHWEQPVSKAASNILLAASDSPSSEATFSTTVAINATTPITTYVAHYAAGYPIKSAVLPAKSGSIAGPQASAVGSEVTYTASPAQYYRFVHWSNSVTKEILSTEETYTFTMPDAQVSLTATFEKIPVEVKLEVPGGSTLGTASGGKETLAGTKLTLKATPAKNTVFAGWYFDEAFTVPAAFPNAIDYRTASISFTPTGERPIETFYARFVSPEEDQFISICSPQLIYTAGETVDETLSLSSCSLPKASVKGLPSGMKFDAKTLKLSGAPTKPGFYEVTFEATNASVKKATEDTRLTVT
ncbi:MAG: putative Ig domain-containing protein, partial [Candidatus Spyradenecus sp.]